MKVFIAVIGFVLSLSACAGADSPPSDDFAAFSASLAASVPGWMEQHQVPGAAIVLVHGGEVAWSDGFGLADKAANTPVTAATRLDVGSLEMPLFAWGFMTLVEEGRIALDTPVDPILTTFDLPPSRFDVNGVTVERLMSYTAGLARVDSGTDSPGGGYLLQGVELVREPGSAYSDAPDGYWMLIRAEEDIVGQIHERFMGERVFMPLDMQLTAYGSVSPFSAAPTYSRTGEPVTPDFGLFSTANDLGLFVAANMPGPNGEPVGRGILEPETVARMLSPMPNTNGRQGLGFALDRLSDGSPIFYYYGGGQSYIAGVPARAEGLVTLTNSEGGAAFNQAVYCAWITWVAGPAPPGCQPDRILPPGIGIGVLAGVLMLLVAMRMGRGRRQSAQI
jgi:CubicO group peptidase (beta-lactamase class C family)